MTTRRKFGMGIAAIIAAQRAPAALIRSLVAARHIAATGTRLPYDAEVEYLQSTGTQWIDTGFHAIAGLGCRLVAAIPSGYGGWKNYSFLGWGNDWQGGGTFVRTFLIQSSVTGAPANIQFAVGDGRLTATGISMTPGFGTMLEIEYDAQNNMFSADGINVANPNTLTYETETRQVKTMPLFGQLANNAFTGSAVRISEAEFLYHGQVVKDLISVRFTNEQGVSEGAMYDRVTGQLFRNQGTGSFVVGPDVVPVEYLESTGTEWIDTGVIGNLATSYEIRALTTVANNTSHILFGARQAFNTANIATHFITESSKIMQDFGNGNATRATAIDCVKDRIYTVYNSATSRFVRDESTGNEQRVTNTYSVPFTTPVALRLFTGYGFASSVSSFEGRVYYCKLWDNGVLVRDFIPVRVGNGSTWEGAMKDTLTHRIYRNAGTGNFSYGADKAS